MALVVDASVTASWLLPIQLDHMTESVSVMELARKHESIPLFGAARNLAVGNLRSALAQGLLVESISLINGNRAREVRDGSKIYPSRARSDSRFHSRS